MHKLLIPLLYFGLVSCQNKKKEQAEMNQATPTNDSASIQTANAPKVDYAVTFKTNAVTEMSKFINSIFQDRNGNYWFASNGEGVYCYDGKKLYQFTTKDGLSDNQVFTIQEDKQNNIWFVTIDGISRFDGKTFTTFPAKDSKHSLIVHGFTTGPNELWFEVGGGAYRYDGTSFSYLLLPASGSDPKHVNPTNPQAPNARMLNAYSVYCSLKDRKGNLWFGTQTLGVCRYDGKTFTWFDEKGLGGPAVRAIFEDRNGNIWFGNNGNGLFRFDGKTLANIANEKKLGNPEFVKTGKPMQGTLARVWSINEDNHGNIWIGTYDSGAWRYDGNQLTNYTTKDGLISNVINTIYKDQKGELWFGTDGAGVCKFDGISFSPFMVKP